MLAVRDTHAVCVYFQDCSIHIGAVIQIVDTTLKTGSSRATLYCCQTEYRTRNEVQHQDAIGVVVSTHAVVNETTRKTASGFALHSLAAMYGGRAVLEATSRLDS